MRTEFLAIFVVNLRSMTTGEIVKNKLLNSFTLIMLSTILISSCATSSSNIQPEIKTISNVNDLQPSAELDQMIEERKVRMNQFIGSREDFSEMQKINYLLELLKDSKAAFERNGKTYSGKQAASWLRRKMRSSKHKHLIIETARDFISKIASRSSTTGRAYELIFETGERMTAGVFLTEELSILENAISDHQTLLAIEEPQKPQPPLVIQPSLIEIPVAIFFSNVIASD